MCCVSPRTICVEKLDFACAGFKSSCALSTTQRIQTDGDFLCLEGFSLRVGDAQQVTAASNGPRRPWENFHVASTPHVRVQWHAMQKGTNAAPNAVKQLESSIAHAHTPTHTHTLVVPLHAVMNTQLAQSASRIITGFFPSPASNSQLHLSAAAVPVRRYWRCCCLRNAHVSETAMVRKHPRVRAPCQPAKQM